MAKNGTIIICMTAVTDSDEEATRVGEVMGRTAIGIGLDGIQVSVTIDRCDNEVEAETPPS